MNADLDDLWQRLEDWLAARAPLVLANLAPGASTDEIAQLEQEFDRSFPERVRTWLRRHNGQREEIPNLIDPFLSTDDIREHRRVLSDHPSWRDSYLPFTHDGAGNCHFVDLESGSVGFFHHEEPDNDQLDPSTPAASLTDWFAPIVDLFIKQNPAHDDEYGWVDVDSEEWDWIFEFEAADEAEDEN